MDHDQRVDRGEDQAEGGDHDDHRDHLEGADQDQELPDEVAGTGQAQRRRGEEQADRRQVGHARPQAAHLAHVAGMQALVELAAEDEQRRGGEAVGDHLHHHALQRYLAAGVDADHHEAHVRNAGVGDQALDVGLREGQQGTVEDADDAEPHGDRREFRRGVGEQRQGEADQAVGGGLQEDAGEVHGAGGGRLGVGVRQPGMHRHHRHLHREGDEEAEHQQPFHVGAQLGLQQGGVVEGDHAGGIEVDEHQAEDRHQHHQAAGLGEDEELGGGVDAGLLAVIGTVSPQRDEEVHRHQHHFPEEEEQEQVDGEEHADHTAQDPQQVQMEEADAALDLVPGAEDREHAEQAGEGDHQQRQAIHRQVDADAETLDPQHLELQGPFRLAAGRGRQLEVAGGPDPQAQDQDQGHRKQRDPAGQGLAAVFGDPAEETADEGDQD
ncbi:Uncharacterised protein [Acinetobacter baumannii]|nr:Uncharacterised protein [Acinetobacter baumannii]